MKAFLVAATLALLLAAPGVAAPPGPLGPPRSCYKKVLADRDCHRGAQRVRPIESLRNHFWEGERCDVVCYCNFRELLCCPRDVFFGPKISFVIPCRTL